MIRFVCDRCSCRFEDEAEFVHHTCMGESDDKCAACHTEYVPVEGAVRLASAGQMGAKDAADLAATAVREFRLDGGVR